MLQNQSKPYPATAKVVWIVEEYERTPESKLTYAWNPKDQSEAEMVLLNCMRANGHTHIYCMYFYVQE